MATASATPSSATIFAVTAASSPRRKTMNLHYNYITGLNSFVGLKGDNKVTSLGLPVSTERSFAKVVSSLRAPSKGKGRSRSGGSLSSNCNAAEIFKIAAIMNGLVLVGVAVGFLLIRIEASLEESE